MSAALRIASSNQPLVFDPAQRQLIRDSYLNGASDSEAAVLLEVARMRGLNPLLGQIHFVKRWDAVKQREVWACQVAIDGFRAIAQRTGEYDGQDEPEIETDERGQIVLARVKVYRAGIKRPFVGVARFAEFAQTKRGGEMVGQWGKMPFHMTAKCAEACAFRKAFPEELSGLYAPEELHVEEYRVPAGQRADNDNATADPVALYTPKLEAARDERALQALAGEIKRLTLTAPQRAQLLDVFQGRQCALRSTVPVDTKDTPQGALTLPEPGSEG